MKILMEEYGDTILAVVAAIGIFGMLVHIITVPFRQMTIDHTNDLYSARIYSEVMNREKPVIQVNNGRKDATTSLDGLVSARDMNGDPVRVVLYEVENFNGEDVTNAVVQGRNLTFTEEGYYRLHVKAVDSFGKGNNQWVYLPVLA